MALNLPLNADEAVSECLTLTLNPQHRLGGERGPDRHRVADTQSRVRMNSRGLDPSTDTLTLTQDLNM